MLKNTSETFMKKRKKEKMEIKILSAYLVTSNEIKKVQYFRLKYIETFEVNNVFYRANPNDTFKIIKWDYFLCLTKKEADIEFKKFQTKKLEFYKKEIDVYNNKMQSLIYKMKA
jgi:hypothetical protein